VCQDRGGRKQTVGSVLARFPGEHTKCQVRSHSQDNPTCLQVPVDHVGRVNVRERIAQLSSQSRAHPQCKGRLCAIQAQ